MSAKASNIFKLKQHFFFGIIATDLLRFSSLAVHTWRPHSQDLRLLVEPQRALGHLFSVRGQHYASLANGKSCVPFSLTPLNAKELNFWTSHFVAFEGLFEITCAGTCTGQQRLGASASNLIPKTSSGAEQATVKFCRERVDFHVKHKICSEQGKQPRHIFCYFSVKYSEHFFENRIVKHKTERVRSVSFKDLSCLSIPLGTYLIFTVLIV